MDNQQPGQTVQPNGQQTNNVAPSSSNSEVAEIDAAMEQSQPPSPTQQSDQQKSQPATNEVTQNSAQLDSYDATAYAEATTQTNSTSNEEETATSNSEPLTQESAGQVTSSDMGVAAQASQANDFTAPQETNYATSQTGREEATSPPPEEPLIAWKAAEPRQMGTQNKTAIFGILVAGVAVGAGVFIVGGVNFSSVLSVVTITIGVITLLFVNAQKDQLQDYALHEEGVYIGRQFYNYSSLKSFSISDNSRGDYEIELEPTKRLMVRPVVHPDSTNAEQVVEELSRQLPRNDNEPSVVDRFSAKLRN